MSRKVWRQIAVAWGGAALACFVALSATGCTGCQPNIGDFDGDGTVDALDCAPEDPTRHPGAREELDDGIDQNCDGVDGTDADGDGFAVDVEPRDCDDRSELNHPGAEERCQDGVDNDCNGLIDGEDPRCGDGDDDDTSGDDDTADDDDTTAGDDDMSGDDDSVEDDDASGDDDSALHSDDDSAQSDDDSAQSDDDSAQSDDDSAQSDDDDSLDDDDSIADDDSATDDDDGLGDDDLMDDDAGDDDTFLGDDDSAGDDDSTSQDDDDAGSDDDSGSGTDDDPGNDDDAGGDDDSSSDNDSGSDDDSSGDDDSGTDDDSSANPTDVDGDGDGFSERQGDCDDSDPAVGPGFVETLATCDSVDNDCDPLTPAAADLDGDGVDCLFDCDDDNGSRFPGNSEVCNGYDDDCDVATPDVVDADGDGQPCDLDCDDDDATNFPGNVELCDGRDNDCSGAASAAGETIDGDGDGTLACADCDDSDGISYPGATELCDAVDQDCDGDLVGGFADADGDGLPDCADPDDDNDGDPDATDCAEFDPTRHAGATEVCDLVDQDCDGSLVDEFDDYEGDGLPDCVDADRDGDGYDAAPAGTDCDDTDPTIHPEAVEACDALDSDCDGDYVDGFADSDNDGDPDCTDLDADGDGQQAESVGGTDCDDADPAVHEGATEACDDTDQDCDGSLVDEFADLDGDLLPDCIDEDDDADGDPDTTDCGPLDGSRYAGATELCDAIDSDCDGSLVDDFDDLDGDGDPNCIDADVDGDGDPATTDCDDLDSGRFAGATEACDAVDQDCDGDIVDTFDDTDGDLLPDCVDPDDDGDGDQDGTDCAPTDPTILHGAIEIVDGADNDCDGLVDLDDADVGPGAPASIEFIAIPAGNFTMGCTPAQSGCGPEESPPHQVTLSHAFWLGETEITQAQWQQLARNNPAHFSPNGPGIDCGDDCPVERVSWYEAVAFANLASEEEDLDPCYDLSACTGVAGAALDCSGVGVNTSTGATVDCVGYRLPSEAEWEYAARAGTDLLYAGADSPGSVAWYSGNSGSTPHPVAGKDPNGWGLFDLSGNVWEWAGDYYSATYYGMSPAVDPPGPSSGASRVLRGGDWYSGVGGFRVASRAYASADSRDYAYGLRLARTIPQPTAIDFDGDGFSVVAGDCADDDPTVRPGATEVCDGLDNDCDAGTWALGGEVDLDGDGSLACVDCDDGDAVSTGPCMVISSGMTFRVLPAGGLDMGCTAAQQSDGNCPSWEFPVHAVTLTRGLWMSETEVTQGQWEVLMETNPSYFGSTGGGTDCGVDCPVEEVNWYEALAFANAASASVGLPACYVLSGCTGTVGTGCGGSSYCYSGTYQCTGVTVTPTSGSVYDCAGYRLPTEAEWEYAARAGTDLVYAGSDALDDVAWYGSNSGSTTHPVAGKAPNAWGLYDMSGNVMEWTWDSYGEAYYGSSPSTDPEGPTGGTARVMRNCTWFNDALTCRVTRRDYNYPGNRYSYLGFRLAKTIP